MIGRLRLVKVFVGGCVSGVASFDVYGQEEAFVDSWNSARISSAREGRCIPLNTPI